jgi:hypothetical protein
MRVGTGWIGGAVAVAVVVVPSIAMFRSDASSQCHDERQTTGLL